MQVIATPLSINCGAAICDTTDYEIFMNRLQLISFMSLIVLIRFISEAIMVMKDAVLWYFINFASHHSFENQKMWLFSLLSLSLSLTLRFVRTRTSKTKTKAVHYYLHHKKLFSILLSLTAIGSANAQVTCATSGGSDSCAAAGNMGVSNFGDLVIVIFHLTFYLMF